MTDYRIGVDVGGTFTDLACLTPDGALFQVKSPTTPDDPALGVLDAVATAAQQNNLTTAQLLEQTIAFVHGTTIGTNALLTGRGPKVGMLCTEGFRDTLAQRRGHREDVWAFRTADPPPLVPRRLRQPVRERIGPDGAVLRTIEDDDVRAAAELFRAEGVAAVAIGFLFGYLNPVHERRAAQLLAELLPDAYVTASHEVSATIGEYERIATTAVNAYLGPPVAAYLADLATRLRAAGLAAPLLIARSNGGVADVAACRRLPASLALSGPAAGVAAARAFAGWLDAPNLASVDMGGTSFDVGVVADGQAPVRHETSIGGQHLALPTVDVHTIGTGGGSLARVDAGGVLRVGPEGAGARPGPACYGLGGELPTVTDANVLLGRLDPCAALPGGIRLRADLAREAIERHVARSMGVSAVRAALGIVRVADAQMADAIRVMTVERGLDPRAFVLLAAGGAAPLHASQLARALGMRQVVVPRAASVYCALGMLTADLTLDSTAPVYGALDPFDPSDLQSLIDRLAAEHSDQLAAQGVDAAGVSHTATVDARYAGRHRELPLPLPARPLSAVDGPTLRVAFDEMARRRFGHADERATVEYLSVRVTSRAAGDAVDLPRLEPAASAPEPVSRRPAVLDGDDSVEVPVYDGRTLQFGHRIDGPALVEDPGATTLLWPGEALVVDDRGGYRVAL